MHISNKLVYIALVLIFLLLIPVYLWFRISPFTDTLIVSFVFAIVITYHRLKYTKYLSTFPYFVAIYHLICVIIVVYQILNLLNVGIHKTDAWISVGFLDFPISILFAIIYFIMKAIFPEMSYFASSVLVPGILFGIFGSAWFYFISWDYIKRKKSVTPKFADPAKEYEESKSDESNSDE